MDHIGEDEANHRALLITKYGLVAKPYAPLFMACRGKTHS